MVSSSFWGSWQITLSSMAMCARTLTTISAQGIAADYERAENYASRVEGAYTETRLSPHWLPSNDAFWYRKDSPQKKFEFIFVDAKNGIRRPAFDHVRLAEALSAQGTEANPSSLPFAWIDPARNGSVVRFRTGDKTWEFGLDGKLSPFSGQLSEEKLQPLPFEFPSGASDERTSITFINRGKTPLLLFWIDPDGKRVAYGTVEVGKPFRRQTYVGHVWTLVDPVTGEVMASFRASANEAQAIIEDTRNQIPTKLGRFITEPHNPPAPTIEPADHSEPTLPGFTPNVSSPRRDVDNSETPLARNDNDQWPIPRKNFPSPDGKITVKYQTTPEQEHTVYMVESSPKDQVQPKLKTNKQYLKPGDNIAIDRPRLYASSSREIPTDDALFQNPWSIDHMGWNADSAEYRFLYNQRGHQILRIIGINQEGKARIIHEEKQKTFIDYSSKIYSHEIKGKDELIWASERDGWNHLYLIDLKAGAIKNQITKGNWVMRSVDKVDDVKRQIWFKAFGMVPGQDPYYAHLARVNFDGTDLTILTEGDGTHTWK
jgi:dipeptidyl-peptidase 4